MLHPNSHLACWGMGGEYGGKQTEGEKLAGRVRIGTHDHLLE